MTDSKTNKMLVNVVLDRSGSMESNRDGTISGYNEYVNGLRADKESEFELSLIQFDAHGSASEPELTVSYQDKPLAEVPELTAADYEPRGSTPLYDAIGECVRRVEAKGRAITMVVITDGMENASKEFTLESVKALIKQKETEGWTFVFIGAEIDSYAVGGAFGMATANISNYRKGQEADVFTSLLSGTLRRSASNREEGVLNASMAPFFADSEKAAMGDVEAQGGNPTGPATFPGKSRVSTKITPPKVDRPKRRLWTFGK